MEKQLNKLKKQKAYKEYINKIKDFKKSGGNYYEYRYYRANR